MHEFNKGPDSFIPKNEEVFGKVLIEARGAAGHSFEQITKELGVDQKLCVEWETGIKLPDENMLGAIAHAYGLPLDELKPAFEISTKGPPPKKKIDVGPFNHISGSHGHRNGPFPGLQGSR